MRRAAVVAAVFGSAAVGLGASGCAPDSRFEVDGSGSGSGASAAGGGGSSGTASGGGGATASSASGSGAGPAGGAVLWAGASEDGADVAFEAVAVDPLGGVFAAGDVKSGDDVDGIVAHFSSQTGTLELAYPFGEEGPQRIRQVVAGSDGQAIAAGQFSGVFENATSAGGMDAFVAKLGSSAASWLTTFGSAGFSEGNGLAFAPDGSLFVAGTFTGELDPLKTDSGKPLLSSGVEDVFVASLDLADSGGFLRAWRFGTSFHERARALGVDGGGNVYVLADSDDPAGHGGGDLWLLKLNAMGVKQWDRHFGGSDNELARGLAVAADGTLVIAGTLKTAIEIGGTTVEGHGFVAGLDAAGEVRFARGLAAPGGLTIGGVALDGDGNVVIAGGFSGALVIGGLAAQSNGESDVFVAKLDALGGDRWLAAFGNSGAQKANAVTVASDGTVIAVGDFYGKINFGTGLLGQGTDLDSFIVGLAP